MSSPRVVVTRTLPSGPGNRTFTDIVADAGITDVWTWPEDRTIPHDDLYEAVRGADAIVVTPADVTVNADLLDAAGPSLRAVVTYAVGYDNVDLETLKARGIVLGNTPGAVTEPTAEIAWLLMLATSRRATEGVSMLHSGEWTGIAPTQLLGRGLTNKTLHIVGAGRIGTATARRAVGWNMRVLYTSRTAKPEIEAAPINAERVSLEEGLAQADVVSVHVALTPETRHMINADALKCMKPDAILVNTARGAVIDETALIEALEKGVIAGAGLDVFEFEPQVPERLRALPNVYLLPHLGTATLEDRWAMVELAAANVIAALNGTTMPARVI